MMWQQNSKAADVNDDQYQGVKPNLKPINVHDANGAVHLCGD